MSDLTSLQASVLANEINLAKSMSTKSINNTNDYINEVEKLKTELYTLHNIVNTLTTKMDDLTNIKVHHNDNPEHQTLMVVLKKLRSNLKK